ncbi:hypothetical protein D4764_04G0015320 [Takifugu flavidus]|uniref:Brinker DNA-binding domain-containing protein n=1 Tax=Takifugu flavidus TaxID=433684 RepID=A0A5C6N709_9TELE|nr:hypothetical protein D4764_04G0015320 [Takifugu flavidus]
MEKKDHTNTKGGMEEEDEGFVIGFSPGLSADATLQNLLQQDDHRVSARMDPKMAPCKRCAFDAEFKLKAISHAVEHGNRAAAREFNVNESMVRKWRKQQDDLRQMTNGEHTFTKTARWRRASYVTIGQWIVNAWASTVVRAFGKAGMVTEMPDNTSDTDPDDETEPAMLDAVFAQLFNSDTEEEEFEGFLDEE